MKSYFNQQIISSYNTIDRIPKELQKFKIWKCLNQPIVLLKHLQNPIFKQPVESQNANAYLIPLKNNHSLFTKNEVM